MTYVLKISTYFQYSFIVFFCSTVFLFSCNLVTFNSVLKVESVRKKLASEELCKLFGYTWLMLGDVYPNVAKSVPNPFTSELSSDLLLAVTNFCIVRHQQAWFVGDQKTRCMAVYPQFIEKIQLIT